MELNKKQLELVENIFKNYNHCEFGQALEQYESDYIMEMNEDTKRFFELFFGYLFPEHMDVARELI